MWSLTTYNFWFTLQTAEVHYVKWSKDNDYHHVRSFAIKTKNQWENFNPGNISHRKQEDKTGVN